MTHLCVQSARTRVRTAQWLPVNTWLVLDRVPTAQGKQGKWSKKFINIDAFRNFAKTQGIWFAQVVNSLILKVKDISKLAAKISQKNFEV